MKKGDRVLIYMPMIAEADFAMLACVRMGAHWWCLAASPRARWRPIEDARARGGGQRRCRFARRQGGAVQALLDEAIALSAHKAGRCVDGQPGLAPWRWHCRARPRLGQPARTTFERQRALRMGGITHPSYTLYTSGTTGKPKGVQRDTGGYRGAGGVSMKHICDAAIRATYFATSDIGWVVGTATSSTAR